MTEPSVCGANGTMKAVALAVASFLVLVLAPATAARAQGAVLCVCYCGISILPPCSEQACKDACHYDDGRGSEGPSGPTQTWYCRALAPNGAWGWGYSSNPGRARQIAVGECQKRADGCEIEACRVNDPSLAQAPSRPRPPPPPAQGPMTPEQAWCDTCTRKLRNDVDSGWASGLVRLYVGQAVSGYENCKLKARGVCPAGDRLAKALRDCSRYGFDAYRQCLSDAIQLAADRP
jgi:hypothetical protein